MFAISSAWCGKNLHNHKLLHIFTAEHDLLALTWQVRGSMQLQFITLTGTVTGTVTICRFGFNLSTRTTPLALAPRHHFATVMHHSYSCNYSLQIKHSPYVTVTTWLITWWKTHNIQSFRSGILYCLEDCYLSASMPIQFHLGWAVSVYCYCLLLLYLVVFAFNHDLQL